VTLLIGYALAAPLLPVLVGVVIVFAARTVAYALYGRGAGPVLSDDAETIEVGNAERDGSVGSDDLAAAAGATDPESGSPSPTLSRRPVPEAPPAVQIGRAVSFGGEIDGLIGPDGGEVGDGADRAGSGGGSAVGFEWTTGAEAERSAESAGESRESAGESRESAGGNWQGVDVGRHTGSDRGFEGDADGAAFDWWSAGDDGEDKS